MDSNSVAIIVMVVTFLYLGYQGVPVECAKYGVDYAKGRIYLPLEDLRRYSVTEKDLAQNCNTSAFCEMMKFEVGRARQWFDRGLPLLDTVDKKLAVDIELFSRGGQEILNAIERQNFAVLGHRPVISKPRKFALVARAALGKLL